MREKNLQEENKRLQDRIRQLEQELDQRKSSETPPFPGKRAWQYLFSTESVGFGWIDLEGRYLQFNDAWAQMLGYSRVELLQRTNLNVTHPDDLELTRQYTSDLAQGKLETLRTQKRFRRKDGEIFWADITISSLRDEAGKVDALFWVVIDISAQYCTEQALQASERRLRSIIDAAPFGAHFYELKAGDQLVFGGANRSADQILKIDHTQFLGKTVEEAFPALRDSEIPSAYRRVAREGGGFEREQVDYDEQGIRGAFEIHAFQTVPSQMAVFFRDITERKQMEHALQASRANLLALIENTNDAIFSVDRNLRLLTYNSHYAGEMFRYFGTRIEPGQSPADLLPPPLAEQWKGYYRTALGGQRFFLQHSLTDAGGERFFDVSLNPIQNDGEITGVSVFSREITERKRTEAALQAILKGTSTAVGQPFFESLVRELAAALEMPFAFVGELLSGPPALVRSVAFYAQGQIVPIFEHTLAGSPCEKLTEQTLCFYPKEVTKTFPENRFLQDLGIESYLGISLLSSSGERLGLLAVMGDRPLVNVDLPKTLLTILGTRAGAEMERLQVEKARRETERRYREMLETVNLLAVMLDREEKITFVNDYLLRLTGWDRSEVEGRDWFQLFLPAEVRETVRGIFREAMEGGVELIHHYDNPILTRSGKACLVSWDNTMIRDSAGRIIGTASLGRDVTEQQNLEEQLRQSQKMESVGRLAGGIAHDFNNLLTAINGYAELMLLDLKPQDPFYLTAREILQAGEKAAGLVRQLLAFSRKQLLQPRILELNQLIRDNTRMLRRLIGEDIQLDTLLKPDLEKIKADPGQLEQVILNLCVNARDAMPKGGRLTLETANVELSEDYAWQRASVISGPYIMLAISDTGCGMDAETLAHIFEPFFTTKEKGKGTGLGLSTVYGIIQQSGGHIWVYSEVGRGTTFKIYLPVAYGEEETAQPRPKLTDSPRGWETVLVVEDEDLVRNLTCLTLRLKGYEVLEATNGGEALLLCEQRKEPIHLLLTDVVMPQLGGRDLARRLKQLRPEMKVLFMSGYTEDAIVHHGVLEPGLEYVQKPFSPEALVRLVRGLLDSPDRGKNV